MLTIVVITKNEEEVIEDCLKSVKDIASEIILVDDYSSDKTVEIAEKYGAKVVQNKFKDFSTQRNFGMTLSKNDWVMYLDSDERLTSGFKDEVKKIVGLSPIDKVGGYYVRRKTFFYGKDWGFSDRVQRLFFKPLFKEWKGTLHETPVVKGNFAEIESPILHFTHRNLSQMVRKTNNWSEYEAELRVKSNHPKMNIFRFFRVMITGFVQSYIWEKGYRNGTHGLIEAIYQSFSMFITYAKLWERQQEGK